MAYRYAFVPATTDAISSPLGLGSDSEPVQIQLMGQDTHLADPMQFALEYLLRVGNGVPGVYYLGCSFRGEDPDNMHLNQFYHVECELKGDFEEGIRIAERYIVTVVEGLLEQHSSAIKGIAGTLDHVNQLLRHYKSHHSSFPRISLDDALKLADMTDDCWQYAVADLMKLRLL